MNDNLIDNLIFLRKTNGYTQSQLADKLGFSDKTISKWECGGSQPNFKELINIAKLYGLDNVEELYSVNLKTNYESYQKDKKFLIEKGICLPFEFIKLYYVVLNSVENEIKNDNLDSNTLSMYFNLLKILDVVSNYKIKKNNYIKFTKIVSSNNKTNLRTLIENKIFKEKMDYDLLLQYIKASKLSNQVNLVINFILVNIESSFSIEDLVSKGILNIIKELYPKNKNHRSIIVSAVRVLNDKKILIRLKHGVYALNYNYFTRHHIQRYNYDTNIMSKLINYKNNEINIEDKDLLMINSNEYYAVLAIYDYLVMLRNSSLIISFILITNNVLLEEMVKSKIDIKTNFQQKEYLKIICMEE